MLNGDPMAVSDAVRDGHPGGFRLRSPARGEAHVAAVVLDLAVAHQIDNDAQFLPPNRICGMLTALTRSAQIWLISEYQRRSAPFSVDQRSPPRSYSESRNSAYTACSTFSIASRWSAG